ncbi:MAG: adenosine deaminase [Pseudobacteriovorax sp.]|nr:adenosine deaminase [Pseudobacteriovorax sp.]
MDKFIESCPKAELHLHIEGSLEPELMMKLAKRNHVAIPFTSVEDIRAAYEFENLQSFLDIYYQGAAVLLKEEDFYDLTMDYLKKCQQESIRHVEIFFDPQTHTDRGGAFETCFQGIQKALQEGRESMGISGGLILCFLRHLSEDEAMKTLDMALPYKDQLLAVGLDSSEQGHPPEKFSRVFAKARDEGLRTVAHAGEEGPASYIWQAIEDLKVQRIDHGVRCLEDAKLVSYLKDKQIPLTVCPLSNIKLRVFDRMADHNLKELMNQGLMVMINSDDPAYFGGYLNQNFKAVADSLDLGIEDLAVLAKNSFTSAFMSAEEKARYQKDIDALVESMN